LEELKDIEGEKEFLANNPHFDLKASFEELDINQRGFINTRDIYDFLTDFLDSVRFRTASKIYSKFRKNTQGRVTYTEWVQFLEPVRIELGAKARMKRVKTRGNLSQRSPFLRFEKRKELMENKNALNSSRNGSRILKSKG
jgi:hypothetical protein